MTFLNWGAAFWLLLVPALVLLYMFRPRRIRKAVPSLRLWQALPQMERTRTRLRRPPFSLLLLLQVLVLAAGAFALTQPAITAPTGRHSVLILDASGSMQALSDGGVSRFEQAKAEGAKLAASMAGQDRITLLRAGSNVTTACSDCDKAGLEAALKALVPGVGRADIQGAIDVASGLARRQPEGVIDTTVISDGSFPTVSTAGAPPSLHFIKVGSPVENRAVVTLSARRPPDGRTGYIAYARIENRGTAEATIEISALADTVPLPKRTQTVPAGGQISLTWQAPPGTARFSVRISPSDALPADDHSVLFLPAAGQYRVNIISGQPALYSRALAGVDGLLPITNTAIMTGGAAFTIIEGVLPDPLPAGSLLLVNPESAFLQSKGTINDAQPTVADPTNPLVNGLDLGALMVSQADLIEPPSWLQTVVDSSRGPLLLAGEQAGRRIAVLTFDPRNSNLPKLAAFPLLMANVSDWLYPLASTQSVAPGLAVHLAPGATVQTPSGRKLQVAAPGLFTATDEGGVYHVTAPDTTPLQFAVNMADDQDPISAALTHPELISQPPQPVADITHNAQSLPNEIRNTEYEIRTEFWLPLAALALALLWGEWMLYSWKRGSI